MDYEEKKADPSDQQQITQEVTEKLKLEGRFKSGAGWFFWIAGLSLINSIIALAGKQWGFVIGLGITQLIDAVAMQVSDTIAAKIIALIFDLIAAGIFMFFGIFARKKHQWSFIVGMVFYGLDSILMLIVQDWLSFGFHIFALFFISNETTSE